MNTGITSDRGYAMFTSLDAFLSQFQSALPPLTPNTLAGGSSCSPLITAHMLSFAALMNVHLIQARSSSTSSIRCTNAAQGIVAVIRMMKAVGYQWNVIDPVVIVSLRLKNETNVVTSVE